LLYSLFVTLSPPPPPYISAHCALSPPSVCSPLTPLRPGFHVFKEQDSGQNSRCSERSRFCEEASPAIPSICRMMKAVTPDGCSWMMMTMIYILMYVALSIVDVKASLLPPFVYLSISFTHTYTHKHTHTHYTHTHTHAHTTHTTHTHAHTHTTHTTHTRMHTPTHARTHTPTHPHTHSHSHTRTQKSPLSIFQTYMFIY
jgi:hypothetical protein